MRKKLGFSLQELREFVMVSRELDQKKEEFLLSLNPDERKNKLLDINQTLEKQLELIEAKIKKFQAFQQKLSELKEKAQTALEKVEV
jgi:DNA-binding transcriptional MerR regulator